MQLAITRQLQSRLGDAIAIYNDIVKTRNDGRDVVNMDEDVLSNMDDVIRQTILVNLGAAHQESGNFDKAIYFINEIYRNFLMILGRGITWEAVCGRLVMRKAVLMCI